MRLVFDVFVAAEEHRIVERGGELAGATADVDGAIAAGNHTVDDGAGANVAFLDGTFAGMIVDREGLSRHHDGAVDLVGKRVDVGVAVLTARVVRRELRDLRERPHLFCHLGGEGSFLADHEGDFSDAVLGCSLHDPLGDEASIHADPRARWVDDHLALLFITFRFDEFERGVDGVGVELGKAELNRTKEAFAIE